MNFHPKISWYHPKIAYKNNVREDMNKSYDKDKFFVHFIGKTIIEISIWFLLYFSIYKVLNCRQSIHYLINEENLNGKTVKIFIFSLYSRSIWRHLLEMWNVLSFSKWTHIVLCFAFLPFKFCWTSIAVFIVSNIYQVKLLIWIWGPKMVVFNWNFLINFLIVCRLGYQSLNCLKKGNSCWAHNVNL